MPPPYTFAPLELLVAGESKAEFVLDADDAMQWVNVLLETVKLLLLRMVLPWSWLE